MAPAGKLPSTPLYRLCSAKTASDCRSLVDVTVIVRSCCFVSIYSARCVGCVIRMMPCDARVIPHVLPLCPFRILSGMKHRDCQRATEWCSVTDTQSPSANPCCKGVWVQGSQLFLSCHSFQRPLEVEWVIQTILVIKRVVSRVESCASLLLQSTAPSLSHRR